MADTSVEQTNVDPTDGSPAHRVIIIDAMAVVNSVVKTEQMKTCQDFADAFLQIVCNMAAQYDEVRLVFDQYVKASLKEQMRTKRTKGKSTYYHVKDNTLIQNISFKNFLSDIRTKEELTKYLADKVVHHSKSSNSRLRNIMMISGTQTKGNVAIPDVLITHSQEEANILLVLHTLTVPNEAKLVVSSPDTDVLLLLVYMYPNLPMSTTFLTGKDKLKRSITLQSIYNNLGAKHASALLGFHALTGSDMSGRFAGRTKDSCFKAFMSCDDRILDALAMLSSDIDLPADVCSQLERFVCVLYRSKIYTKVNELCWSLYSNRAAEGENLTLTSGSLEPHIRRAHYITMIWRKADKPHPSLPAPTSFGWTFDASSNHYPIHCLNPPAPEAVLHLIKYRCKRGCEGRRSCRKNNIPCTEVCGCWIFSCSNKAVQPGMNEDCDD